MFEEESYSPKQVYNVDETGPSFIYSLASPLAIDEYNISLRVTVTKSGFGFLIGFIGYLQVVSTINYYNSAALHNVQSLHTNLLSLFPLVFTGL
jgi:hypothetical protein